MGLNAVQTLIPWFLMEPTPGAFVTDGFVDIVRFAKLCDKHGLKIVLRPGPFICDGPDFGARSLPLRDDVGAAEPLALRLLQEGCLGGWRSRAQTPRRCPAAAAGSCACGPPTRPTCTASVSSTPSSSRCCARTPCRRVREGRS